VVGNGRPTLRRALDNFRRTPSNLHRLWAASRPVEARQGDIRAGWHVTDRVLRARSVAVSGFENVRGAS
jgi:hypothetical protein